MNDWTRTAEQLPPENVVVETMDSRGVTVRLARRADWYFYPDLETRVYYTPVAWRLLEKAPIVLAPEPICPECGHPWRLHRTMGGCCGITDYQHDHLQPRKPVYCYCEATPPRTNQEEGEKP